MRKIREVLRLRFDLGLQQNQNCPQLFDRSSHRPSLFTEGCRGRLELALLALKVTGEEPLPLWFPLLVLVGRFREWFPRLS